MSFHLTFLIYTYKFSHREIRYKGSSFCEHKKIKRFCKQCNGTGLCSHGRVKKACKDCRNLQSTSEIPLELCVNADSIGIVCTPCKEQSNIILSLSSGDVFLNIAPSILRPYDEDVANNNRNPEKIINMIAL